MTGEDKLVTIFSKAEQALENLPLSDALDKALEWTGNYENSRAAEEPISLEISCKRAAALRWVLNNNLGGEYYRRNDAATKPKAELNNLGVHK